MGYSPPDYEAIDVDLGYDYIPPEYSEINVDLNPLSTGVTVSVSFDTEVQVASASAVTAIFDTEVQITSTSVVTAVFDTKVQTSQDVSHLSDSSIKVSNTYITSYDLLTLVKQLVQYLADMEVQVSEDREVVSSFDSLLKISNGKDVSTDSQLKISNEKDVYIDSALQASNQVSSLFDPEVKASISRSVIPDMLFAVTTSLSFTPDSVLSLSNEVESQAYTTGKASLAVSFAYDTQTEILYYEFSWLDIIGKVETTSYTLSIDTSGINVNVDMQTITLTVDSQDVLASKS